MSGLHDGAQMGKTLVTFVVRLCAILAALAIVPWPASFAASERKSVPASAPRLALVIGNADYVKLGQLDNPGKDAQLIAEKLRQLSFDVTEKLDRNLKGMADDVDEFAQDQGAQQGYGVGALLRRPRAGERWHQLSGAGRCRHQTAKRRCQ